MNHNTTEAEEYARELLAHIQRTHEGHYSGLVQPKDLIESIGAGPGFYTGNIIKYTVRNFKTPNVQDILKIAHYNQLLFSLARRSNEPF